MQSKALRDLRAALHPIVEEQIKKYVPIDYATRVTAALRAGRGSDALLALQGMLARSQTARQGTVQRWVRDCDSIDDVGLRVRLLHAVLRAGKPIEGVEQADGDEMEAVQPAAAAAAASAGGEKNDDDEEGEEVQEEAENDDEEMDENEEEEKADEPGGEDSALGSASVIHLPAWSPEEEAATEGSIDVASAGAGVAASVSGASYSGVGWATSGSALAAHPEGLRLASEIGLRVVKTERGPDRQPPNNYDLNIWVCAADAGGLLESNAMRQAKQRPAVRRMDVPGVPGAFVMLNVLTRGECAVLSTGAERIGFVPDHPSSRPAPSGIGGLEWLLTDGTSAPTSPRLTPCVLPISALCSADRPAPSVLRRPVGGAARALPALSTGHARRRQAGWHQQPLPPLQIHRRREGCLSSTHRWQLARIWARRERQVRSRCIQRPPIAPHLPRLSQRRLRGWLHDLLHPVPSWWAAGAGRAAQGGRGAVLPTGQHGKPAA